MGLRIAVLLTLGVVAAACATRVAPVSNPSVYPPGGPVPADYSLCDLNPAPSACSLPDWELTAATARKRIDAEYARLQKVSPAIAREFAVDSFTAAELSAGSSHYAPLRNRAWRAAFEASEEDGGRYFLLRDLGKAAFEAGDREMARETIRQRHISIRRRGDDQEWEEWKGGDVIHSLPREEVWRETVIDAARFGEPNLAISVLDEAVPEVRRNSHEYLSRVAAVRQAAGQYSMLESLARRIIKTAPYRFGEMRRLDEDEKIGGRVFLIISLLKQGQEIGDLAEQLFYQVYALPAALSSHADNLFAIAGELADASPEIARRFLKAGQEISRIGGSSRDFFDRYLEVDVCKTLRDDVCLLELARAQEAEIGIPRHDFWAVAVPYAIAGDFVALRRLFRSTTPEHCAAMTYPLIAERLKLENELTAISGWLRDWVTCQVLHDPNETHWTGLAANHWSGIAHAYARLSHWHSAAGSHRAALNNAKMALLLAIETQTTWNHASDFYRAGSLASAYGSALGALVRAEAAVARR